MDQPLFKELEPVSVAGRLINLSEGVRLMDSPYMRVHPVLTLQPPGMTLEMLLW